MAKELSPTLDCQGKNGVIEIKLKQVGQITDSGYSEMTGRVYDDDGLAPTIRTMGGGILNQRLW